MQEGERALRVANQCMPFSVLAIVTHIMMGIPSEEGLSPKAVLALAYSVYFAPGLAPSSTAVRKLPVQVSGEPASFGMAVTVKAVMGDPSGTGGACSVTKTVVAAVESARIAGAIRGTPAGGSAGACLNCTMIHS